MSKARLGMPTLIEFNTLEENVELCSELALDFIELNMNLPICNPESLDHQTLLQIKKEYGIDFTIHLPEELDLSSFHPSIRKGHIDRCIETLDWAKRAKIKTVNMHLNNGIYFTLPDSKKWINEQYETEFRQTLMESYNQLYGHAANLDIQLCIENTCNFSIPFVSRALDMLSSFENFFLTWDVGHDAKANFSDQPIFKKYSDRIHHMHLHDYNGNSDHQPLFSGIVPIQDRLTFAKDHNLTVVIEVKTSSTLRESVRRLT